MVGVVERDQEKRIMARTALHHSAVSSLLLLAACGGAQPASGGGTPAETCPVAVAPAHPTFTTDILPAIQPSCGAATTTCHGGPSANGHVDYSTSLSRTPRNVYDDLVGVPPANAPSGYLRVAPRDASHSWIVAKVSQDQPGGSGYGARMPLGRPNLCAATVEALLAWIADGAPF
jgi:hypothetical protein